MATDEDDRRDTRRDDDDDRRGGRRDDDEDRPRRGHARPDERKSLLVRNVSFNVTKHELQDAFERYGDVRDVHIPLDFYTREPRGFAFVEFADADDASRAMEAMEGKMFDGRAVKVVFAQQKRKRPDEMAQIERGTTSFRKGDRKGGRDDDDYDRRRRDRDRDRDRSRRRDDDDYDRDRSRSPARSRRRDYDRDYDRRSRDRRSRDRSRERSRRRGRRDDYDDKADDDYSKNRDSKHRVRDSEL